MSDSSTPAWKTQLIEKKELKINTVPTWKKELLKRIRSRQKVFNLAFNPPTGDQSVVGQPILKDPAMSSSDTMQMADELIVSFDKEVNKNSHSPPIPSPRTHQPRNRLPSVDVIAPRGFNKVASTPFSSPLFHERTLHTKIKKFSAPVSVRKNLSNPQPIVGSNISSSCVKPVAKKRNQISPNELLQNDISRTFEEDETKFTLDFSRLNTNYDLPRNNSSTLESSSKPLSSELSLNKEDVSDPVEVVPVQNNIVINALNVSINSESQSLSADPPLSLADPFSSSTDLPSSTTDPLSSSANPFSSSANPPLSSADPNFSSTHPFSSSADPPSSSAVPPLSSTNPLLSSADPSSLSSDKRIKERSPASGNVSFHQSFHGNPDSKLNEDLDNHSDKEYHVHKFLPNSLKNESSNASLGNSFIIDSHSESCTLNSGDASSNDVSFQPKVSVVTPQEISNVEKSGFISDSFPRSRLSGPGVTRTKNFGAKSFVIDPSKFKKSTSSCNQIKSDDVACAGADVSSTKRKLRVDQIIVVGGYVKLERSNLASENKPKKYLSVSFHECNLESVYEYPAEKYLLDHHAVEKQSAQTLPSRRDSQMGRYSAKHLLAMKEDEILSM